MLNRFRMLVACALTFALCWVPGFAFAGDAEHGAQVAATAHGLSYGIEGFERLAWFGSRCGVEIGQGGREVWIGSAGQRVRSGSQGARL